MTQALILLIHLLTFKRRNPRFGSPRIAQIISHTFGIEINKDVVRRILETHYKPDPSSTNGCEWRITILQQNELNYQS